MTHSITLALILCATTGCFQSKDVTISDVSVSYCDGNHLTTMDRDEILRSFQIIDGAPACETWKAGGRWTIHLKATNGDKAYVPAYDFLSAKAEE